MDSGNPEELPPSRWENWRAKCNRVENFLKDNIFPDGYKKEQRKALKRSAQSFQLAGEQVLLFYSHINNSN